jgi:hypothetical protein
MISIYLTCGRDDNLRLSQVGILRIQPSDLAIDPSLHNVFERKQVLRVVSSRDGSWND